MPGIGLFLEGYVVSALISFSVICHFGSLVLLLYSHDHFCIDSISAAWHLLYGVCAAACHVMSHMTPYNSMLLLQIFSISNNSTLFKQAYPKCWSKFTDCNVVSGHI